MRAWVAGSSGGIGAACVAGLTGAGWEVVGTDLPTVDITRPGVAEAAAPDGPLRGAVHAIGMSGRRLGDGPLSACTDEAWETLLRVNLSSAFWFLRAALARCEPGASIVLVGSVLASSLDPSFLTVAYRVSKAALVPLVEAAAYEAAPRRIRVNLVAPALVDTPMAARASTDPQIRGRLDALMPLSGAPSGASTVADAVCWLLGTGSAHTTGTVVRVDAGWSLR
ncbi:SDR family oxidoreductase [Phytohabitans sp. ZYX-F-186]|uniref:SDR family oxidoreductase n=1 Tax=Phytohabitans maris TaxID=3071409 RepID=A0ABU0ZWA6_9ACTN|nr:SDR family oxidoreductase [Phytohabitans sp. ZYX-F-186]MDQ7911215.1 SDR family oxidoreductase [Phytohabitans sp. ZYX-F-186]